MGELTRQELDTKLDAVKAWMDARFAEQRSWLEARLAEEHQRPKTAEQFQWMDARFVELNAKMDGHVLELIKWMIGTSIAALVIFVAILRVHAQHVCHRAHCRFIGKRSRRGRH